MTAGKARLIVTTKENSAARSCGQRTIVRSISAVMRAAHSLWGKRGEDPTKKPDIELASRMSSGLRSAQYALAGKKGVSGDGLANLLVSDAGPRVFREFTTAMDDATLAAYAREIEAARLRNQQAAITRRLESIEREGGQR